MRVGYGKVGRSMPLSIERCGFLGGDVEMAAVVKTLALRHPDDTFVLIGRNDGSRPEDVGLPSNIENPWIEWGPILRQRLNAAGMNHADLSIEEQLKLTEIFDELTLPTIRDLDGIVLWVGQHGTTNMPIPKISDRSILTKPHDWCAYYCGYLMRGVNVWRDADPLNREEIYLNADARNKHKMRDLKWPLRHPILTQFNFSHPLKHERYGDGLKLCEEFRDVTTQLSDEENGQIWVNETHNVYARLEVNGLIPGTPFGDLISYDETWEDRGHFGLFINEANPRTSEATRRKFVMRDWVLPLEPTWVHGTWSKESQEELGRTITAAPWDQYYPRLHAVRSTFTTPSSGSGWATAKPWEAFAAGTVCFFHPLYDTQDNILGDASPDLKKWLRVSSPQELKQRVDYLSSYNGRDAWQWIVHEQRKHFEKAISELSYLDLIEQRLYG